MRVALPPAVEPAARRPALGIVAAVAGGMAVLAAVGLRHPALLVVPLFLSAAGTLDFLAAGVLIRRPRAERSALLAATFTVLESMLAVALRSGAIHSGGALAAATACAGFILFVSVRMLYEAETGETVAILYLCTAPWLAMHAVLAPAFLFAD
jgi:hypothetical protein